MDDRAVQFSPEHAHVLEDTIDVQGIVVEGQADVGLPIRSQQIEREAAQPGEDTGVLSDAAGVLLQSDVFDIVDAVLDARVNASRNAALAAGSGLFSSPLL